MIKLKNKKDILFFLFFSIVFACSNQSQALDVKQEKLNNSIGKLLILHDKKFSYQNDLNSLGSAEVFMLFEKEFHQHIANLPLTYRIDYFWSSMWHLSFDGDYMSQFQQIVYFDCGDEFILRLTKYIKIETELNRSKKRLYLSKKVLGGLLLIRDRVKK